MFYDFVTKYAENQLSHKAAWCRMPPHSAAGPNLRKINFLIRPHSAASCCIVPWARIKLKHKKTQKTTQKIKKQITKKTKTLKKNEKTQKQKQTEKMCTRLYDSAEGLGPKVAAEASLTNRATRVAATSKNTFLLACSRTSCRKK
jgi:hypothetical protein